MIWYGQLARWILPRPTPTPAGDKPPRYIFSFRHRSSVYNSARFARGEPALRLIGVHIPDRSPGHAFVRMTTATANIGSEVTRDVHSRTNVGRWTFVLQKQLFPRTLGLIAGRRVFVLQKVLFSGRAGVYQRRPAACFAGSAFLARAPRVSWVIVHLYYDFTFVYAKTQGVDDAQIPHLKKCKTSLEPAVKAGYDDL